MMRPRTRRIQFMTRRIESRTEIIQSQACEPAVSAVIIVEIGNREGFSMTRDVPEGNNDSTRASGLS